MYTALISIFATLFAVTALLAYLSTSLWKKTWLKLRQAMFAPSNSVSDDIEVRLKEASAALANNSIRDSLTGLYNRRHFFAAFQMEWTRAARDSHHLAILMIDIDNFQQLTESCGQPYTARLARQLAHSIGKGAFRNEHMAAHIGPGKFALILPGASLSDSHELADSISANVPRILLPDSHAEGPLVSVSIGGSCCIPQHRGAPAKMLREADLALNQARINGTNQIWRTCVDEDVQLPELTGVPA